MINQARSAHSSIGGSNDHSKMKTGSEKLFERFCDLRSIRFDRLPEQAHPYPDYCITVNNNKVVIEIKQINKNNSEKLLERNIKNKLPVESGFMCTGAKRIRKIIDSGNKQLKGYTCGQYPSILLIFDNTYGLAHIENDDILEAMYGDMALKLEDNNESQLIRGIFGGKRKMTQKTNTTTSALGWLMVNPKDNVPYIDIFHNCFSKFPFDIKSASYIARNQFQRGDSAKNQYRDWKLITLPQ